MTITVLDFQAEKTQSAVTTLSATLNGVTGTDVAIVVAATARTVNTTFSISWLLRRLLSQGPKGADPHEAGF